MAQTEYQKKWEEDNREKRLKYKREYYQSHKEEARKRYQAKKKDKLQKAKVYYQLNKEKIVKRLEEYNKSKYGRALYLLGGYRRLDKQAERGECTITAQWIVDNIFSECCHYCGETDWTKLGCDRIDNTKPHTSDNCVPCCFHCNSKRRTMPYNEFKNKTVNINDL